MKKNNLFIFNTIIILICSVIVKTISSFFDVHIANKLGSEAIGVYSLVMSIYMFAVTVASSGIGLATTKILSEEIEKKDEIAIPHIIYISCIYCLFFGMLASIILIIFSPIICSKYLNGNILPSTLYVLAISLPFVSFSSAINGYFLAYRKVFYNSLITLLAQFVKIILIGFLLNYFAINDINKSVLILIFGNTTAEIFSFFLLYCIYNKKKRKNVKLIKKEFFLITKEIIKVALPIAITSYIRSFLHSIKHILIPLRLKLSGVSYETAISSYGIITGMAFPIIMYASVFVYSYSSLLIPEFSRLSVEFNKEKLNKNISKIFKITLYFSICVTGILMYYGKDIGNILYNNKSVGYYIKILSPLIVIMYLDNVIDNILKGLGKQVSVMLCNILDLIISISFIYFLLPIFSTNGYIIVLYISEILNYSISVITLFKTTDLKFKYFNWVILPIICIVIAITITSIIPLTTSLILQILLCSVIYLLLIKLSKRIHII